MMHGGETRHGMHRLVVSDGDGKSFDAVSSDPHAGDGNVEAWVLFDEESSGFGTTTGEFKQITGLRRLEDGTFGL